MKEQNIIYGLYEPESLGGKLRYIGQSAIGIERAYQHKKKSNLNTKTHKVNWIKSLLSKNLMYEVKILLDLGTFSSNEERDTKLNEEEIRLIKYHKEIGNNLTNSTEGGEGTRGNILSGETKKVMSEKRKLHIEKCGVHPAILKNQQPKPKQIIDGKEYKHCSDCDSFKPLIEFHKNKNKPDGLKSICKNCSNKRINEYRETHPKGLTDEEWKQSYEDRKEAMSLGIKAKYDSDPEYRKKNSKAKSKPIIAYNVNDYSITLEFPSALIACEQAGFNNTYISQAIKSGKPYKGYYWKFKNNI